MSTLNNTKVSSFNFRVFFNKLLFHWPLGIIFFCICFSIAVFYLKYKRPVYEIYARVMIKDQQKEAGKAALEAINLTENTTTIDAQMGLMGSIPVTRQVVEDLQLWVNYFQPTEYYSYKDIYMTTPVHFQLISSGKGSLYANMEITIESDSTYLIKRSDKSMSRFFFKNNVINNLGTWKLIKSDNFKQFIGKSIQIRVRDIDDMTSYYQSAINGSPNTKSSIINLSLIDEVPERGREIMDDFIRVYMAASVEEKRKSSQNTIKFVEQRLGSITQELNSVESKYEGYKSDRGITEITDQSSKYVGNAQTNDKQLNEIKIKISLLDGIERYLNSNEGKGESPSTLGVDDPTLQGVVDRLSSLQLERTKMLSTLPESNPLFNPINQQILSTKVTLRENIKTMRAALLAAQKTLQNVGSGFESNIRSVPGAERDLNDIKRMQGIKENLYIYLLQKKEELSLDYASTISDAVVIDHAHNGSQVAPIPQSVYAIAFLFSFLIPIGIIFGRDAFKNKVLSKSAIISATGLPVLNEITEAHIKEPIVVLNQKSFIGEEFRDLRTKLNYLHNNNKPGRTTLFTSSISGEGKSFVLSNLGAVLAVAGKKTVVLELDLRRPTFSTRFSLKNPNIGVTDYIIGNATKAQIIQVSEISDDLHVICGGSIPPNPSELLESEQLRELINELKLSYDHVLIDTPPMHLLTDTMIVANLCDVCLYVIRYNYTPNTELDFVKDLYVEKKLPKINLIFNAVENDNYQHSYLYHNNSYIKAPSKTFKSTFKKFLSRF